MTPTDKSTTLAMVEPELLGWARRVAGLSVRELAQAFAGEPVDEVAEAHRIVYGRAIVAWEAGKVKPTLIEAERLAEICGIGFGFLFLARPPYSVLRVRCRRFLARRRSVRGVIAAFRRAASWLDDYADELYQLYCAPGWWGRPGERKQTGGRR